MKNYASFSIRLLARFFDLSLVWLVNLLILSLLSTNIKSIASVLNSSLLLLTLLVVSGLFFSVIYYSYFTSAFGGTLGKLLFGLRVEDEEGKNLSFKMSFFRHTVGYMVSNLVFGLGYYWVIRNKETRQGWHDGVSHSFVVVKSSNVAKSVLGAVFIIFLLFMNTVLALALAKNISSSVPALKKEIESISKPLSQPSLPKAGDLVLPNKRFQTVLSANCKPMKPGDYNLVTGLETLPLYADTRLIVLQKRFDGKVLCEGTPGHGFYLLPLEEKGGTSLFFGSLLIYNSGSEELGHGGPSMFGLPGQIIKETPEGKMSMLLLFSDAGSLLVGQNSLAIRGERVFKTDDGDEIFANYQIVAIDGSDPRLVSILKKYAQPAVYDTSKLEVSYDADVEAIYRDIKITFFSDMSNLAEPEKSAVQRVETILGGLSAK